MTKDQPQGTDQARYDRMAQWAENEMELNPASTTALRGKDAAAHARAMFEAAGLNVAELNKVIGGRPSLDPDAVPGSHSPKLNFRVPAPVSQALTAQAGSMGMSTSALARKIIEEWLSAHQSGPGKHA
ncbi:hypothetical protein ACFRJ9_21450 [Paenarthrobacter sp. NPDC056912]|uniref:hypothetical protein n=1 Tax=Paenarthrobacter sp. NPDC056912 TaxID=3345965 RepID=UPI0036721CF2